MAGRSGIVVIGAGMAGLSAAAHLAQAGWATSVLDASDVVGGRIASHGDHRFEAGGEQWSFPDEHGIHGFFRQYRNLTRLIEHVGAADGLRPVPDSEFMIRARGRTYPPIRIGDEMRRSRLPTVFALGGLYTQPGMRAAMRDGVADSVLSDLRFLAHAMAYDPGRDASYYDQWAASELLDECSTPIHRFNDALARSGAFSEPTDLSLAGYLAGLHYYTMGDKRNSAFRVLDRDSSEGLLQPLCETIQVAGGDIRLETPVQRVVRAGDGYRISVADGPDIDASAVVMAVDPSALRRIVDASPWDVPLPPLHATTCTSSVVVRLWFSKCPSPGRAATGVAAGTSFDAFFWLNRLQSAFRRWTSRTGGAVVECHLYAGRATRMTDRDDDDILATVVADVERLWPGLGDAVVHGQVRRNAAVHPSFGPGSLTALPGVTDAPRGMYLAGDWVQTPWSCFHLERATLTGLLAAREAAAFLGAPPDSLPKPIPPYPEASSITSLRRVVKRLIRVGVVPSMPSRVQP